MNTAGGTAAWNHAAVPQIANGKEENIIDIREYSYILAYVDNGSLSKAAEKLFISQPSLSMYIKNLEQRLGFHFFEKAGGRNQLTPEGMLYIDYARQIMKLSDNLHSQLKDFQNLKRGLVRMGITHTRASILLPRLLPLFREQIAGISVEICEGTSRELEEKVFLQELDFAILNYPFRERELAYTELQEQEIVMVVPKDNPLCQKAAAVDGCQHMWIDVREAREEPFILLRQGQKMRQAADKLFAEAEIEPVIIHETNSAFTANNLTAKGLGISFMLDSFYANHGGQEVRLFSVGNPRSLLKLVIAYQADRKMTLAGSAVMNIVQSEIGCD